jgi:flagellar hook-associated protein 2
VGSTVDGLVSGLSTSSMISQLMQIEAAPQTRLKTKVTDAQSVVTAYQSVNTKIASLKTAADSLGQLSTWRGVKPVSSSTAVTATATAGSTNTTTGSITFDVVSLARAQVSTARVPSEGAVTGGSTLTVTTGTGDPASVDISADQSAQGISDAINAAGLGVKASVVKTSSGDSVLQLTGTKTGAENAFTVEGLDFEVKTAVTAQDATVQVGGAEEEGGYTVTSSTNTFTGLMNGVTLTASKVETGVTVDVTTDTTGIADKIKAMVDAANDLLTEVGKQTAYNAGTGKASTLTGDFMVRQISQAVLSTVSQGQADLGSLSKMGVELDRSGKLTFKKDTFEAAYNADPGKLQTAGISFADTVENLTIKQTADVTNAVTGRKSFIDSMNAQIDNWDIRLSARQEALTKQYASLETALSNLRSQSSYLSSQLG